MSNNPSSSSIDNCFDNIQLQLINNQIHHACEEGYINEIRFWIGVRDSLIKNIN